MDEEYLLLFLKLFLKNHKFQAPGTKEIPSSKSQVPKDMLTSLWDYLELEI
jgi:hypothetical protein